MRPLLAFAAAAAALFVSSPAAAVDAPVIATADASCAKVAHTPRGVLFIGDSITAAGFGNISARFYAAGRPVCINARPSRPTSEGVDVLRRYVAAGLVPGTVVMALGTNDTLKPPGEIEALVEATRAAIGPYRKLYWVNVYNDNQIGAEAPEVYEAGTYRVNNEIFTVDRRDPATAMIYWNQYIAPRAGYLLQSDRVHPTAPGNVSRTITILNQMNTLWVRTPAPRGTC